MPPRCRTPTAIPDPTAVPDPSSARRAVSARCRPRMPPPRARPHSLRSPAHLPAAGIGRPGTSRFTLPAGGLRVHTGAVPAPAQCAHAMPPRRARRGARVCTGRSGRPSQVTVHGTGGARIPPPGVRPFPVRHRPIRRKSPKNGLFREAAGSPAGAAAPPGPPEIPRTVTCARRRKTGRVTRKAALARIRAVPRRWARPRSRRPASGRSRPGPACPPACPAGAERPSGWRCSGR